jgi:hypothetical protein
MPISVFQTNKLKHKRWIDSDDSDTECWFVSDNNNALLSGGQYGYLYSCGFKKKPALHSVYTVDEVNNKIKSEITDKMYTRAQLYTKQEVDEIVGALKSDYEEQLLNLQNSLATQIRAIEAELAEKIAD